MKLSKLDNNVIEQAEELLRRIIRVDGNPAFDDDLLRLAMLEYFIQVLKYKNRVLEFDFQFENFINSEMSVSKDAIEFYTSGVQTDFGTGTRALDLQPKLLMFLLVHHHSEYAVFDILKSFVYQVWDDLELLDFKKTRTGAMRCFTNTRFAANTLRDYGLLRFTKKEAYKTWVLSLPGFLVASRTLEAGDWTLRKSPRTGSSDLHQDIRSTVDAFSSFDVFVAQLAKICQPRTSVFCTFEVVLQRAYLLLEQYWKTISDTGKSKAERQKESNRLLEDLAASPGIEDFYEEFSLALLTDDLLRCVNK